MEPVIVKNIFTKEELDILFVAIKNEEHLNVEDINMSRSFYNLNNLPVNIVDKITKIAEEKTKTKLKMTGRAYSKYTNKNGEPSLQPHVDKNDTKYIFDYQVSANVDWPIFVENNKYQLKDNEALIFSGKNSVHWRPKKIFKNEDFVSMIFFHFIDLNDLETSKERTYEEQSLISQKIIKEYSFYYESKAE
jgi:hypothetical protein